MNTKTQFAAELQNLSDDTLIIISEAGMCHPKLDVVEIEKYLPFGSRVMYKGTVSEMPHTICTRGYVPQSYHTIHA